METVHRQVCLSQMALESLSDRSSMEMELPHIGLLRGDFMVMVFFGRSSEDLFRESFLR